MNPSVRPSLLALSLNLVGVAAVGYALIRTHTEHRPVWVLAVGLASVVLWAVRGVLARLEWRRSDLACTVAALLTGALVAAPTDGLTVVPAAVAVLIIVGDRRRPLGLGIAAAAIGLVLIAVGAVPFGTGVPAVLSMMGGLVLGIFAGVSRRQFRRSEEQAALLREREVQMREEAARISIARDLHDVLAHSLGGLVVQLDAVDALLEAGETAPARSRVVAARGLAVEGLTEARRAVAALRDPAAADAADGSDATVPPAELRSTIDALLAAHRGLAGSAGPGSAGAGSAEAGSAGPASAAARLDETGRPRPVGAAAAAALERALQEALSNARKHAPGSPVTVRLAWQDDRVRLIVENPAPTEHASALAATGGGNGLVGMRERFAALPGGGDATAAIQHGRFVVTAEARLP